MSSSSYAFLGHNIQPVGLGLAALGRPGYINVGHNEHLAATDVDTMRQQSFTVLDAAYAAGVRYFDAARSYGKAEEFLAEWLASRTPKDVVAGSKWGYRYAADWRVDTGGEPHEVKDHSVAHLRKQWRETDALLGRYIHLYQIHSATLESGVLSDPEVLAELFTLKREKGWKIGLSLSGVQQAETLRKALTIRDESSGALLFDSAQATWNLLEQSAGPALCEAHQLGLAIIVKEGMANGRLLNAAAVPKLAPRVDRLRHVADELRVPADALALAAVMLQPFRPMVLSGAATAEHARSNVAALQFREDPRPRVQAAVAQLVQEMRQEPAEYWGDRSGLAWN